MEIPLGAQLLDLTLVDYHCGSRYTGTRVPDYRSSTVSLLDKVKVDLNISRCTLSMILYSVGFPEL